MTYKGSIKSLILLNIINLVIFLIIKDYSKFVLKKIYTKLIGKISLEYSSIMFNNLLNIIILFTILLILQIVFNFLRRNF